MISGISLALSIVALWVAVRGRKKEKKASPSPLPPKSVQQRRQEAVARREWENFMSYDGGEQPPIDPDSVLGE